MPDQTSARTAHATADRLGPAAAAWYVETGQHPRGMVCPTEIARGWEPEPGAPVEWGTGAAA